jgi:TonB family protein
MFPQSSSGRFADIRYLKNALKFLVPFLLFFYTTAEAKRVAEKQGYIDLPRGLLEYEWPTYPFEARLNDLDGEGLYRLEIDRETGRVSSVIVLKSTTHKILDDAAIKAFRKWRFQPNRFSAVRIPAIFTINGHKLGEARRLATYAPQPDRPVTARNGRGTYRFIVDYATGNVTEVKVLQSSGRKDFDRAVVKAYRQWRFVPHTVRSIDTTVAFGP